MSVAISQCHDTGYTMIHTDTDTDRLSLSQSEMDTIYFVGNRYGWSLSLLPYIEEGDDGLGYLELDQYAILDIREGIDSDMEGGHNAFPLLAQGTLMDKLIDIYEKN